MSTKEGKDLLELVQGLVGLSDREMDELIKQYQQKRQDFALEKMTLDDVRVLAKEMLLSVHVQMTQEMHGPEDDTSMMPQA